MLGRKKKEICEYWECNRESSEDDFLCAVHHEKWLESAIDRCPKCNRFKDIMYELCLDCYVGRKVKRRKLATKSPKPRRFPGMAVSGVGTASFEEQDRYFVYVIKLDDGVLYVGHTMDIRDRLSEFRKKKASQKGHDSGLRYLEFTNNEKDAEAIEAKLKNLVKSDPDQMQAMSQDFQSQMHILGLE